MKLLRPLPVSLLFCLAVIAPLLMRGGAFAAEPAEEKSASASDLAKYDLNHDGKLDDAEVDAKRTQEARAAVETRKVSAREEEDREPVQEMDPFTVTEDKHGYYGSNAMSGTRLNSKVEDLGSSVSVVTLEQMDDFAMLDINDIFTYEAGTEGLNEYTSTETETSGNVNDNSMSDPTSANRVRGYGAANISLGNFETSKRVPIDKIGIDGVEITRGPNSSIFGLGNPAGTVNVVSATGNLNRDRTKVEIRADSFGGYRESLDLNRVIIKNKLAFRFSEVYMHQGNQLKPSGSNTQRLNFMVKYQPRKNTIITASYLDYRMQRTPANTIVPRDGNQDWLAAGSPTWDPVTSTAYNADGSVRRAANAGGNIPNYFTSLYQNTGRGTSLLTVDGGQVTYWTPPRGITNGSPLGLPIPLGPSDNNPAAWDNNAKTSQAAYNYVVPTFGVGNIGLKKGAPPLTAYDWRNINLAAINREWNRTGQSLIQITQTILDTPTNLLAVQGGWFRETSKLDRFFPFGKPYGYYYIDVNRRRLDGTANPNYLRPFISIPDAQFTEQPLTNDTYRAQLAYKLDLRREKGWVKWLGMHQIAAFGEYKHFLSRRYVYKPAIVDNHPWLPDGVSRATSSATTTNYGPELYNKNSPVGSRNYAMYYVGDNNGNDIDYAPTSWSPGVYNYRYGNVATGNWVNEPTQLGFAASLDGTGQNANILKIQKTTGVVLQSHLINDSIVPTLGLRRDNIYDRRGVSPRLLPNGLSHDVARDEQWDVADDWANSRGTTTTRGVVVRPLTWIKGTRAGTLLSRVSWFDGMSFFYNKSDSFLPDVPAVDLHLHRVPNPTGLGKDYGFWINLFDGKFNMRFNRYENRTIGSRSGVSSTLANRILAIDIYDGAQARDFALSNRAQAWLYKQYPDLTPDQMRLKLAETMKVTPEWLSTMTDISNNDTLPIAEPENTLARGNEIEFNYNPNRFWTVKGSVTEKEVIQGQVAQGLLQYINERMPVWTSMVDPLPPATTQNPTGAAANWWTYQYNGPNQTSAKLYYDGSTVAQALAIAVAQEGLPTPQFRRYSFKLATNYRLEGITDHPIWKGLSVGGAVRWMDKGAIGYWATDSTLTVLDKSRPIYDPAHWGFDLTLGYQTKLFFTRRTGAKFQLNVKNLQEGGRLQPIAAYPDGMIKDYRIIEPRLFLFTASFDL